MAKHCDEGTVLQAKRFYADIDEAIRTASGRVIQGSQTSYKFNLETDFSQIANMPKSTLKANLPKGWSYYEHNGFVHIKDSSGITRVRIDPPDSVTPYNHYHLYNANKQPLDINGNIVDKNSPDAHIPYNVN
jgi:hypothetical protein